MIILNVGYHSITLSEVASISSGDYIILYDDNGTGEPIDSGEIYDAIWNMIKFDDDNYNVLGTMILTPESE